MDRNEAHLRTLIFRKTGGVRGKLPRIMEDQNYQIELVDNGDRTYTAKVTDTFYDTTSAVDFSRKELRKRANRSVLELVAQPEPAAQQTYQPTVRQAPTTFRGKVRELLRGHHPEIGEFDGREEEYDRQRAKIEKQFSPGKLTRNYFGLFALGIAAGAGSCAHKQFQAGTSPLQERPAIVQTYDNAKLALTVLEEVRASDFSLPYEPDGMEGNFKEAFQRNDEALDKLISATKGDIKKMEAKEMRAISQYWDNKENRENPSVRGSRDFTIGTLIGTVLAATYGVTFHPRKKRQLKKLDRKFGKA